MMMINNTFSLNWGLS